MEKFLYKKCYGQNFINDKTIIDDIVSQSEIDNDTLVVEIGPGMGVLSKDLVKLCKNLIMIEIDVRLEKLLKNLLKDFNNYELVIADVLKLSLKDYINKYNYKQLYVIANLPYYITSPILTKITNEIYPDKMIVMVQEEVADRLCAQVGCKEYGYSTVFFNSFYDVSKLFCVNRTKFTPSPNVDSAVIKFIKNKKTTCDMVVFDKFIKDCFRFKRKTIKNNLFNYDINKLKEILEHNNLSLSNRAEDLDIYILDLLCNELYVNFM